MTVREWCKYCGWIEDHKHRWGCPTTGDAMSTMQTVKATEVPEPRRLDTFKMRHLGNGSWIIMRIIEEDVCITFSQMDANKIIDALQAAATTARDLKS